MLPDPAGPPRWGGLDDPPPPDYSARFAGRCNRLAGRIAPGARARADHLADDDDAHQAPPAWWVRRRAAGRERQARPLAEPSRPGRNSRKPAQRGRLRMSDWPPDPPPGRPPASSRLGRGAGPSRAAETEHST